MNFKTINNSTENEGNHLARLKELFNLCDDVIITSPFLMSDFTNFLNEINVSSLKKIHLITTLPPKSLDQIKKIGSLVSLIEFPDIKNRNIECQISLNNKLHGKIYIFKKNSNYISAIISSANFTERGLSINHEWGIEISNKEEIINLENSILVTIEYQNISFDKIYQMQQETNDFLAKQPQIEPKPIDLNLTNLIPSVSWSSALNNEISYWLKPIGASNDPVLEDRLFGNHFDRMHFSKTSPTGVKPNDILITYGVGTTKVLSIYEVTTSPIHVTQEEIDEEGADWIERWPWYVNAKNLTPNFGGNWPKYNLYISSLKEKYLDTYPNENITAVGGKTLGALNYGHDKLKLSPRFAKYIIDLVVTINDKD